MPTGPRRWKPMTSSRPSGSDQRSGRHALQDRAVRARVTGAGLNQIAQRVMHGLQGVDLGRDLGQMLRRNGAQLWDQGFTFNFHRLQNQCPVRRNRQRERFFLFLWQLSQVRQLELTPAVDGSQAVTALSAKSVLAVTTWIKAYANL